MKFRHALILVIARILGLERYVNRYGEHFIRVVTTDRHVWLCIEEL